MTESSSLKTIELSNVATKMLLRGDARSTIEELTFVQVKALIPTSAFYCLINFGCLKTLILSIVAIDDGIIDAINNGCKTLRKLGLHAKDSKFLQQNWNSWIIRRYKKIHLLQHSNTKSTFLCNCQNLESFPVI